MAESDYYLAPVLWAVKEKITAGTGDGTTFSPNNTCTTGRFLTFLWRAAGSPKPAILNPYRNVSDNAYYAKAAIWAYEKGIVDSDIDADALCTRASAVTYLWKYAGSPAVVGTQFADVPASAHCARAVAWAVKNGITSGTGDGTLFSPNMTCTRAQIATFLYRAAHI